MRTLAVVLFACGALVAMLSTNWPLTSRSRDPLVVAMQQSHLMVSCLAEEQAKDGARLKVALKGAVMNREISRRLAWLSIVMMSAGFAAIYMLSRKRLSRR